MSSPSTPDTGLFGPDSVTWRVHADPILFVGGIRALLLQALHPVAMAGVAAQSGFRDDPWGRLQRTAEYVGVLTYGTCDEARRAAARVRGVHRRLRAVDPDSGQTVRVDDPDLLIWVHACEVDSLLSTARRAGVPLSPADADRYVGEQARAARLVGIPASLIPESTAGLAGYFDSIRPRLRATDDARAAARFVLLPPMPAWVKLVTPARPAWIGAASLGFALLPRWARRMYGLPGLPSTDLSATLAARAVRSVLRPLPAAVREGPALRAARARLAAG
ncbi:MAG: DUF2236 domain-containing protein [Pseudonocardiales bacterium]|nr:MAG: DUF2236 domain-containing protein [Pseudonocardiales bacterium]